jgi:hypothetical protein
MQGERHDEARDERHGERDGEGRNRRVGSVWELSRDVRDMGVVVVGALSELEMAQSRNEAAGWD